MLLIDETAAMNRRDGTALRENVASPSFGLFDPADEAYSETSKAESLFDPWGMNHRRYIRPIFYAEADGDQAQHDENDECTGSSRRIVVARIAGNLIEAGFGHDVLQAMKSSCVTRI